MLVLKRFLGERVLIGRNVVLTLIDVGRGWARIGIDAPRETVVLREELVPIDIPDEPGKGKE